METKLYVGNLAEITTSEDLRLLFARAGRVVSVEVIKDRGTGKPKGFAFVEMASQGDAGKAVSEYNGYNLDNRRIKVMVAHQREPRSTQTRGYSEYKSYNESIRNNRSPGKRW